MESWDKSGFNENSHIQIRIHDLDPDLLLNVQFLRLFKTDFDIYDYEIYNTDR